MLARRKKDAFHTELIDIKTGKVTEVHTSDLDGGWKKRKKCKCVYEEDD